jgi:hypothetical protein
MAATLDDEGNITMFSGDDDFLYLANQDDSVLTMDLRFTIKPYNSKTNDDSDALYSVHDEIVFIDDDKKAVIPIAINTKRVRPGVYTYDIQSVENGYVDTLIKAKFTVVNDITKTI